MIIDLHTRIWESTEQLGAAVEAQMCRRRREPWRHEAASTEAHDAAMAPVGNAVILGFESNLLGAAITHEKVAQYVGRNPRRYVGFAGIDPTAGRPAASLEHALELGLLGVAISPSAQGFHPADTRAMGLYEACQSHGVPVFVECDPLLARDVKMEFGQPYLLDEVARSFPRLKLVISSLGWPWVDQGLALIGKHPTVFADLSGLVGRPWQLYNALLQACQLNAMEQIVFGSGFPFGDPEKAIVTLYSVNTLTQGTHLTSVPREQIRSIIERDTFSCLGIRDRHEPYETASASLPPDSAGSQAGAPALAAPAPSTSTAPAPAEQKESNP